MNQYQQHFGLTHIPLAKNSPHSGFWMNESFMRFKEYFESLLHTTGIGLLTGEPGTGKTAILRHMTQELNPHQYQVLYLAETQFTSFDIYRQLALMLGLVPNYRFADLWRSIKHHIQDRVEHKRSLPVLIIDEAQNLPLDFFRGFPSFLNYAFDAKDMMTVWFVGHPALTNLIDRAAHTALSSRIQVRHQLYPVIERESFKEMIAYAFKEAGAQSSLLSDSGIELLRIASQGRPRNVHRILVTGMQLAAKTNLHYLSDDLLQEAIEALKGNVKRGNSL